MKAKTISQANKPSLTLRVAALAAIVLGLAASAAAQTEATIYNFGPTPPTNPYTGVTLDSSGNLYGVSYYGQTAYKLSRSGNEWQATTLYTFTAGDSGLYPSSPPVFDFDGNLYGVAAGGGAHNQGVVYKLTPTSQGPWQETVLYSFTGGKDGAGPAYNVIFDKAGNLYGTTSYGGSYANNFICQTDYQGCGTIFELSPTRNGQWNFHLLYTFTDHFNDFGPAFLAFDSAADLYASSSGGPSGFEGQSSPGSILKFTPSSSGQWTPSVIYDFANYDGGEPGNIVFDSAGNIYGPAFRDGTPNCETGIGAEGCGEVFKLSRGSGGKYTLTVLYAFSGYSDGAFPEGLVLLHGNLYGDTFQGGSAWEQDGNGVIFELSPNSDGTFTETTVFTFQGSDGSWPESIPVVDSAGNLYGTTVYGGANGAGVAWEYTP
jgi:uncharacterized repeat protein (TIGR03803 family)